MFTFTIIYVTISNEEENVLFDFDLMTEECSAIGNFAASAYYNHAHKSTITTIATIEAANLYKEFIENIYPLCIKKMIYRYYAELIQKNYTTKKEWEELENNIDESYLSMNFCIAFIHPREREEKYSIRFADHPDIGYENGIIFFDGAPDVYHVQIIEVPEGYSFDEDFEMYTDCTYGDWVLYIQKD